MKYILKSTALVPIAIGTKVVYDKYKEYKLDKTIYNACNITFGIKIKTVDYLREGDTRVGEADYGNGFIIKDNMVLKLWLV